MPSRLGYLLGALILASGVALGAWRFYAMYSTVRDFPRFDMPGQHTVTVPAGSLTVYSEPHGGPVEAERAADDDGNARCRGHDATGANIEFARPNGSTSYQLGSYRGHSMFEITVKNAGPATLDCVGTHFTLAVGDGLGFAILGAVFSFLGGIGGGVVLMGVTFDRRRRARRAAGG